jgi:hypothetical protein
MRGKGWLDQQNFIVERRYIRSGKRAVLDLATEMVVLHIDVMVVFSTEAAVAAKQAIPIAMVNLADPVATGFAASLASREYDRAELPGHGAGGQETRAAPAISAPAAEPPVSDSHL